METYGSLGKEEKVDFILEQMRLTLAKKDFIRAFIIARKARPLVVYVLCPVCLCACVPVHEASVGRCLPVHLCLSLSCARSRTPVPLSLPLPTSNPTNPKHPACPL